MKDHYFVPFWIERSWFETCQGPYLVFLKNALYSQNKYCLGKLLAGVTWNRFWIPSSELSVTLSLCVSSTIAFTVLITVPISLFRSVLHFIVLLIRLVFATVSTGTLLLIHVTASFYRNQLCMLVISVSRVQNRLSNSLFCLVFLFILQE